MDKDGGNWKTVFFGTSWVAIYDNNPANGEQVLGRIVEWFGGCEPQEGVLEGHVTDAFSGDPLAGAQVSVVPDNPGIQAITDPNGYYSMTLPVGVYDVTAEMAGYISQTEPDLQVQVDITTTVDFALEAEVCEPVTGTIFTWQPPFPAAGQTVTFTASASGSPPISYAWDFGDGSGAVGQVVTHSYASAGAYTAILTATNACSQQTVSDTVVISPPHITIDPASFDVTLEKGGTGVFSLTVEL